MTNTNCQHEDTYRIGEVGGRFQDEWCRTCGCIRSWDNYTGTRERAEWILPTLDKHPDGGSLRFGKEICPKCKKPRDTHEEWDFRFCS
jgi:hypothetical protein